MDRIREELLLLQMNLKLLFQKIKAGVKDHLTKMNILK